MSETRDNSGVLFKNDKQTRDKQPSHTGKATIDGVDYFMDAWVKEGAKGRFFSFAFKRKDTQRAAAPANKPAPSLQDELSDDIPF